MTSIKTINLNGIIFTGAEKEHVSTISTLAFRVTVLQ
jgi:hypothetical protein